MGSGRGMNRVGVAVIALQGAIGLGALGAAPEVEAEPLTTVTGAPAGDAGDSFTLDAPIVPAAESRELASLASMDLEALMNLEVSTATLTKTSRRLVPGAVTYIDRPMIDQANPRSLVELLDIYVPNLHYELHMWEPVHLGMRGIISDRDDKYLLLTNGRVMNERTHFGALTERDQVLLGDLHHVDVVRGPGSAVYGPGAISMVIAQQTYTGFTFQGTDLTARGGIYEEFFSLEARHGGKSDEKTGYFLYAGVARYNGADQKHSPLVQGFDFSTSYGEFEQGKRVPYDTIDMYRSYRDNPQVKLHAQIDADGLTLWARYTLGGRNLTISERGFWANPDVGWFEALPRPENGYGYQQITLFGGYKKQLNEQFAVDVSSSFDITEYERFLVGGAADSYREQKLISKALLHWTPNDRHHAAIGAEYGYYWLGLPSLRSSEFDGLVSRFGAETPRWDADMLSFVGEYQWRINDHWSTIISGRADKHKFTDWMFSPRGAIAFMPTDKDTIKFIASQSLRTNFEEEMKAEHDATGDDTTPEEMQTLELRYERQHNPNLFLAGSVFYNDLAVLGWDGAAGKYSELGDYQTIGAEIEAIYRTDRTTVTFSHSWVKLLDISIEDGVQTVISSKPLGYGDDLANWPIQMTKLTVHQQLTRQLGVDGSVRVQWAFPGDEDFLRYRNDNPFTGAGGPPSSNPGWDEPYGPSVFLNLGAEYRLNENATLRLDAYNILGWIDDEWNKRGFLGGIWEGQYRAEAAALGISFRYEF